MDPESSSQPMGTHGKKAPPLNPKTRRGRGKQIIRGGLNEQRFSILGNNANGLKAKIKSLKANIEFFKKPSCVTIQETKLRQGNLIKIEGYKIFEKNRTGFGGGVLTAIIEELEPVLISDGDEDNEILVVQAKVGKENIRVINAYAPQEDDDLQNIISFWHTLEKEIISAVDAGCFVLIQMDANAKVGSEVIKGDPNKQSDCEKLLLDVIERQNL